MKNIEVVAAVLYSDGAYFVTQRGYGEFENLWEFPGGKVELGETHEEALKREISEELDVVISVDRLICTIEYDYPQFHLKLHCYRCSLVSGKIVLREHKSAKWLIPSMLHQVKWLPADEVLVERLMSDD